MKILITGVAGFIGAFTAKKLLSDQNNIIVGLDNLNDYYDVSLKEERLKMLSSSQFTFVKGDICNRELLEDLFKKHHFDKVIHLAAQAGVRYSITNPDAYINSNIIGFYNILECCRHYKIKHLVFASSSSVYGDNTKIPYSTDDKTDNPVSLYAATKKCDEVLAYSYSKLYNIPMTGLRFFTVYGPMGRPDMAYYSFALKFIKGESVDIYNFGNCQRDFTYIDDIVEGIVSVVNGEISQSKNSNTPLAHFFRVYNLGNGHPENLLNFVNVLHEKLKQANVIPYNFCLEKHLNFIEKQKGDVEITFADMSDFEHDFGYKPATTLEQGLEKFALWLSDTLK